MHLMFGITQYIMFTLYRKQEIIGLGWGGGAAKQKLKGGAAKKLRGGGGQPKNPGWALVEPGGTRWPNKELAFMLLVPILDI